jgi:hypothetical protein
MIDFGAVKHLTSSPPSIPCVGEYVEVPISSWDEGQRMQAYKLYNYFDTEYMMHVETDGFPRNPNLWNPEWLKFDYIGAPWTKENGHGFRVGNAGCSIQSKKLRKILWDNREEYEKWHPWQCNFGSGNILPSDQWICQSQQLQRVYKEHSIKFADLPSAIKFSYEFPIPEFPSWNPENSFAFHGVITKATKAMQLNLDIPTDVFIPKKTEPDKPKDGYPVLFHTGDLGDIIACMPVMRELGGVHLVIGGSCFGRTMRGPRFEAIKPLLELQPYILSVTESDDNSYADFDMTDWRQKYNDKITLTESQSAWCGFTHPRMDPWLHGVIPDGRFVGRVVMSRSSRYHARKGMWQKVLGQVHGPVFIGTPEEHIAFQREFSCRVDYHPTNNLLEVAQVIKGSSNFYCNQSSPFWIAAGLGVKLTQEQWNLDSTIKCGNMKYIGKFEQI